MKRFKWHAKKHWWKLIPIAGIVHVAIYWFSRGSDSGSHILGLAEFEDEAKHGQVTQATFRAADHELTVTLADGSSRTVVYPVEYDDELTTLLLGNGVQVTAENPSFFDENQPLFLVAGIVLLFTIVPMIAIGAKSRLIVRGKRVNDIPTERFSDVLCLDEQITELEQLTDYIRDPGKYERAGVRMSRGWLFTGPPGTGKTLLAKALAGEANVPFYAYSGSDFAASFVGEGASRVRQMFKAARNAAFNQIVIILIDEIDAVGAKRGSTDSDGSVEILNQLLVELDGFLSAGRVVVIGATNRKAVLDPALLRPGRLSARLRTKPPRCCRPIRRRWTRSGTGSSTSKPSPRTTSTPSPHMPWSNSPGTQLPPAMPSRSDWLATRRHCRAKRVLGPRPSSGQPRRGPVVGQTAMGRS